MVTELLFTWFYIDITENIWKFMSSLINYMRGKEKTACSECLMTMLIFHRKKQYPKVAEPSILTEAHKSYLITGVAGLKDILQLIGVS